MRAQITAAIAVAALATTLTACSSSAPAAAPSHTSKPSAPATATATPDPTVTPLIQITHTPDPAADAKAAAILQAETDKIRAAFEQAQQMDDAGQTQWWASFGDAVRLETEVQDTFKQADANFTAETEPASIGDWRNTSIEGDLQTWVIQPKDTEQNYVAPIEADLATMDAKAAAVKADK